MFPVAFALVAGGWEAYKAVGPRNGGTLFGARLLARTGDREMPHTWKMVSRLSEPEVRGGASSVGSVVVNATWYSLRAAFAAFVIGAALGIAVAVLMSRYRLVERALMPYLVVSQTVPIIVLGPLILALMSYASRDLASKTWIATVMLGVFLAFFPVAVGTLRGLQSTPAAELELMNSLAASWRRTLFKLRFPSAVPFIAPALRLAGAAAVVGVVVSEISVGVRAGVGRLILSYGQEASTDPPKLFTAVFGAAALGLVMASIVALIDKRMMRRHPPEGV
jgi:NitT/TauT family transport system permease protein